MRAKGTYKRGLLLLVVSLLFTAASAMAATTQVSSPTYLTANGEYDRNPSIIYDGSDYWLFYTKADQSAPAVRGVADYDPDADNYVVFYKTANTISGLASASETKLALSESARPSGFDQRVVSATYFNGEILAFVSSGQSGTDRGMYYYKYSESNWAGPNTLIADATARGGHVNVTSDAHYVYIVWESSDGSSDCYTWDGTTLNPKVDISSGNQPKITLFTGSKDVAILYVVNVEDGTGDIEVFQAATDPQPAFGPHSTAITGAGLYDPCIFNDGSNLYVISAPWVSSENRQYLVQTKSVGTSAYWAPPKTISYGGHTGTAWWEYWPCGYHDGSQAYVFFTSETDVGPFYSDGEISYIKLDWNLGNNHYFHIQNAVDQAISGDLVNVAGGKYIEQVTVNKSLRLQGVGESTTTIQAPSADRLGSVVAGGVINDYLVAAFPASGTIDVRIEGFTIDANGENKSSGANRLIGVFFRDVKGTDAGLFSCTIKDFATTEYESWGVLAYGDAEFTVDDNDVSGFTRDGIAVIGDDGTAVDPNVIISDNIVTGSAIPLNGIYVGRGGTGTISGNTVKDLTRSSPWAGVGILVYQSNGVAIGGGNTVQNCWDGIVLVRSDGSTVSGNILTDNVTLHIGIDESDNNQVSANTITGTATGTEDKAIGLSNGATGNTIGGSTPLDGNDITLATSGSSLLYVIYIQSTVGTGSNAIQYNTVSGGTRFVQVDGGNSGTVSVFDNSVVDPSFAGVYLNGGSAIVTRNNLINTVRPVEFWGAINVTIFQNIIDGSSFDGINCGAFSGTVTVSGNAVYNTTGKGIWNRTTTLIDASGNWWGDNTPAGVAGEVSTYVDYSPWLDVGTDTDPDTPGFQGDFSDLWVDDDSPQSGTVGRIQEAIDQVIGSQVNIASGTYGESIVFASTFDKDGLVITGNQSDRPIVAGGVRFLQTATLDGITFENLQIKGLALGADLIFDMDNAGAVNDFSMDNCVLDGENISGRSGFGGQNLSQTFSISNTEFKNIIGWAVMDIESGSGNGGSNLPFSTITFAENNVHDCNGSVALRGSASDRTDVVNVYGNTFTNIGGNQGELGEQWAAFEINHAQVANVYQNLVDDVAEGQWGEGQAVQLWDIVSLDMYDNDLTNCYQGVFIFGGSEGGTYGGPYAVPGGSIHDNDISGNSQYGLSVDAAATGGPLNTECNWWGSLSGPYHVTANPTGQGNSVSDNVDFEPWSNQDLSLCEFTTLPNTVWVDDNFTPEDAGGHYWEHDAFDNIQDGVNRVAASGMVVVAEGTYVENVVVAKPLSLNGAGSSSTILDGNNVGNTVTITASDVMLSGFEVTGGWANGLDVFYPVGGVVVDGNGGDTSLTGITVENNIIDGNLGNGIYVSAAGHGGAADNVIIRNCQISNNGGANAGISLTYPNYIIRPVGVWDEWKRPKNILVQGNTIYSNSEYGVYLSAGQYNVIRSNIMRDNSKYGLQLASSWNRPDIPSEYTTVDSNDIYDNVRNGVKLTSYNQFNTFVGNNIYNNGSGGTSDYYRYGFLFQDGNDNTIQDNIITSNALGGLYLWGKGDPSYTWYSTTDNNITGNTISDHTATGGHGIYIPVKYTNPNSGFLNSSINGNRITDNLSFGLENADATQIIDAYGNWWGAYCGPYHPATNPIGQGNEVSDNVGFDPWCDQTFTKCDFTATPSNIVWVDNDYTSLGTNDGHYWCYDAFDKIQDGVNAVADGGTVNVSAGTYEEQVRIDGKNLDLAGAGIGQSIIEAVPVIDRSTYSITQWNGSSRTINACVGITSAGTVNVSGFTVDGKELGPNDFYGIHYFNTNGSVTDCRIEDITYLASPSSSRIVSLVATHGIGDTITVDFSNNTIPNFQKGGIVVMGPGATFTVNGNMVTGVISSSIAGNCIQLSYGATGSTAGNRAEGTAYTGADWASTGILLFECGDVSMNGDEVYDCQSGINFSDWGWIYDHPVPLNLDFTDLVLDNNEWSLGVQLSRDNSDLNMTVTDCDVLNSTGDGIDFYCTGLDPWGGSYYTGWDNGDLNATVTACNISGSALDGIWGADYSGNPNNVSIQVNGCVFSGNSGSAINNCFLQMMDATACYWDDPIGPTVGAKSGSIRQVAATPSPYGDDLPQEGGVVMTESSDAAKGSGEIIYGLVDYSPWWGANYMGDSHTSPWTWYVDTSNNSTIQEGIDIAASLDVLRARPGIYVENMVIDKSLALLGAGADSVIVYPAISDIGLPDPEVGPSFRGSQICVVQANDITIEGLTFDGDNPTLTPEGTIDARNGIITNYSLGNWSNLKVRNCTAKNIYLRAIYASAQTPNYLTGVEFNNNTVSNVKGSSMQSAGIMLWGSSGDVKHNNVSDASLGIFYHWNSDGNLDSNTVTTSELGLGVNNNDLPTSISRNVITDSDQGIQTIAISSSVNVEFNQINACTSGVVLYGGGIGETNVWDNKIEGVGAYLTSGVWASTDLDIWGLGDLSANLKRNTIRENFYGIVLNEPLDNTSKVLSVLIGGAPADYNLIYDNANYELLMEYCNDDQTATYNYWNYSSYADIENEIFHKVDQATLGLVEFDPPIVYGDVNLDGAVNLGDVIFLLNYLFKAGPEPEMFILADINGDGKINLGDVIYLLNYLFKSGPPPPPPPSSTASLVPAAAKSAPEKIEVIRPVDFHSVEK